jgi:hypothetical protein
MNDDEIDGKLCRYRIPIWSSREICQMSDAQWRRICECMRERSREDYEVREAASFCVGRDTKYVTYSHTAD